MVVVDLLGTALITVAMAVDAGRRLRPAELVTEANPVMPLVNASAALVVVYVVTVDWRALWTVGVVVAVLFFALRAHNALRRRTESVEQLGQFTGELGGQLDVDAAAQAAVAWMTRVLKADVVELTLTEDFAGRAAALGGPVRPGRGRGRRPGQGRPRWRPGWTPARCSCRAGPATARCWRRCAASSCATPSRCRCRATARSSARCSSATGSATSRRSPCPTCRSSRRSATTSA